jgi:hypothetical protein
MKRRAAEGNDDGAGRYRVQAVAGASDEAAMPLARGRRHAAYVRKQRALNEQFAAWLTGQVRTPLSHSLSILCSCGIAPRGADLLSLRHSVHAASSPRLLASRREPPSSVACE